MIVLGQKAEEEGEEYKLPMKLDFLFPTWTKLGLTVVVLFAISLPILASNPTGFSSKSPAVFLDSFKLVVSIVLLIISYFISSGLLTFVPKIKKKPQTP